jgi:hypothetical protein
MQYRFFAGMVIPLVLLMLGSAGPTNPFVAPPTWRLDKRSPSGFGSTPPHVSMVRWWHSGQDVILWTAFRPGMPTPDVNNLEHHYPPSWPARVVGSPLVTQNAPCHAAVSVRYATIGDTARTIRHHISVFMGNIDLVWSLEYAYTEVAPDEGVLKAIKTYCDRNSE